MSPRYVAAFALLAAALVATQAWAVGKVSSDPNTPQLVPASSTQQDARLAKKITVKIGGARLHAIADELTAVSGVRVRCGKNASDWPVRDLPIDVFAKDVPLGQLAGWIAETAHVALIVSKSGNDSSEKNLTLSLRRDKKGEKELADDEARGLAEASWQWDAMCKLGQQPDPGALEVDPAAKQAKTRRLAARILASLPTDTKDRVFAGEAVLLDAKSSPQAPLIRELVLAIRTGGMSASRAVAEGFGPGRHNTEPSESDPEHTVLAVQLFDLGGQSGTTSVFVLSPMVCGSMVTSYDYALAVTDEDVKGLDLPARPRARSSDSDPACDCGGSKRQFVASDKDWESPVLQTKVKLNLPDGERTYAGVLAALAEASGFSVVCEDFVTCRIGASDDLRNLPADTTIGGVLKKLNACWFSVDQKEQVILGWARNWRGHQRDLVPESLISNLSAKIHGEGAELDDVTPLANLSTGQMNEWIRENPELKDARLHFFFMDKMLWRVYDSLSPEAKALAKTKAGVPLAGLDVEVLREDFRRLRRYDELSMTMRATADESETKRVIAEAQTKARLLADPAQLQGATLRIESSDIKPVPPGDLVVGADPKEPPVKPGDHRCWMELTMLSDAGAFTLRVDGGPGVFPVRVEKKAKQ